MVEDEQIRHLRVVKQTSTSDGKPIRVITQPVTLSRTPADVVTGAPYVGEQTDEILRELGYDATRIQHMRENSII
jgi:crotonobetainyl-CoA:carnitine CoA-transferase CaiB-like acyl-CoA transferase